MAQRITPEKVNRPEQFQRFPDSSVTRAASGNISGEVLHCPPQGAPILRSSSRKETIVCVVRNRWRTAAAYVILFYARVHSAGLGAWLSGLGLFAQPRFPTLDDVAPGQARVPHWLWSAILLASRSTTTEEPSGLHVGPRQGRSSLSTMYSALLCSS